MEFAGAVDDVMRKRRPSFGSSDHFAREVLHSGNVLPDDVILCLLKIIVELFLFFTK